MYHAEEGLIVECESEEDSIQYWAVHEAVSLMGLFIVTEDDVAVLLYEPEPAPVQIVKSSRLCPFTIFEGEVTPKLAKFPDG